MRGRAGARASRRRRDRHLQRLPDPLRGGPAARRAAPQRRLRFVVAPGATCASSAPTRSSPPPITSGEVLRMPVAHGDGRYAADADTLAQLEARGPRGVPLRRQRVPTRANPNGSSARHRRHLQRRRHRGRHDAAPGARDGAPSLGSDRRHPLLHFHGRPSRARGCRVTAVSRANRSPDERPVTPTWSRSTSSTSSSTSDRGDARPRADLHRTGRLLARSGRSTARTSTPSRCSRRFPADGPQVVQGPGENAGVLRCPTAGRWRSRSSRTTTRPRSSRTRARRPASAASCATSSRWARARSRCSTRCASARSTTPRNR